MNRVSAVVFDIGNVLIRWDPRNLYRALIADPAAMEHFLAEVCNDAWNLEQDRGRTWADAVAERTALFPEHSDLIRAYDERWTDMIGGPIDGTVAILDELAAADVPLFAVTNFSAEKYRLALDRYRFLQKFRDTVVSAHERVVKPDPAIYRLLIERNGLEPARSVFIDDNPANVEGAKAVGMMGIHFRDPDDLRRRLADLGLPLRPTTGEA